MFNYQVIIPLIPIHVSHKDIQDIFQKLGWFNIQKIKLKQHSTKKGNMCIIHVNSWSEKIDTDIKETLMKLQTVKVIYSFPNYFLCYMSKNKLYNNYPYET